MSKIFINGELKEVTDLFIIQSLHSTTLSREDGPAIIWENGDEHWLLNGFLHRLDGPAIIYADGLEEYHINGVYLPYKKYLKVRKWL